jgi:hypothetical protein
VEWRSLDRARNIFSPLSCNSAYIKHTDIRAKRKLLARAHGIIILLVETSHFKVNVNILSPLVSKCLLRGPCRNVISRNKFGDAVIGVSEEFVGELVR